MRPRATQEGSPQRRPQVRAQSQVHASERLGLGPCMAAGALPGRSHAVCPGACAEPGARQRASRVETVHGRRRAAWPLGSERGGQKQLHANARLGLRPCMAAGAQPGAYLY